MIFVYKYCIIMCSIGINFLHLQNIQQYLDETHSHRPIYPNDPGRVLGDNYFVSAFFLFSYNQNFTN